MRDVDIPLTIESIETLMVDWKSYVRTEALVLRNGSEYAVVELFKDDAGGLFRGVRSHRIVSLPSDTIYVEDKEMDVLNLPAMAALQLKHPGKTIVVRGMFSHISFVSGLQPLRLKVIDNAPPYPAKLGVLVKRALASGYVDLPIVVDEETITIESRIQDVRTSAVMFPCRVSNLEADIPYYFLDDAPELKHEVTLIGCHLSKRIFRELYGKDTEFVNVCPSDFVDTSEYTIVKCCKVKNGHEKDGRTVRVPWGATVPEVVDAINDLFSCSDS